MSLFYQHNINENVSVAVWHIEEDENFFLQKVHLKKQINHPHKRLQHLAARYLLQVLHPEFPVHLIEIAESNKPLLADGSYHFSISHCGNFAAAIISKNESAGIDAELIKAKVEKVKHKFLSDEELALVNEQWAMGNGQSNDILTLLWSCKEAAYKWYGKAEVDFKKHIIIKNIFFLENDAGTIECMFIKDASKELLIHFKTFKNLCLAWVTA